MCSDFIQQSNQNSSKSLFPQVIATRATRPDRKQHRVTSVWRLRRTAITARAHNERTSTDVISDTVRNTYERAARAVSERHTQHNHPDRIRSTRGARLLQRHGETHEDHLRHVGRHTRLKNHKVGHSQHLSYR